MRTAAEVRSTGTGGRSLRTVTVTDSTRPSPHTSSAMRVAMRSRSAKRSVVTIEARVRTVDKTGVEMEALTAAAVAGLTVYDMVKAVDRGVVLTDLCLMEKSGGKSGHWRRKQ